MEEPLGAVTARPPAPVSWLLRGLATPFVSLLLLWPGLLVPGGQPEIAPAHGRPYLMPPGERARIQALIQSEPWARAERERLRLAKP